jgi:hypothetical protein
MSKSTATVQERIRMEIQSLVCGAAQNAAIRFFLGISVKNKLDRPFFAQNAETI